MEEAVFTKSLTVALQPEAYDQIKAITDKQKISMADWVRVAVDAALEKKLRKEESSNDE